MNSTTAHRAARAVVCAAACIGAAGCHARTSEDASTAEVPAEPPEVDAMLDLELSAIAVRRGELRVTATMNDGSPDVSLWTGAGCDEKKEIGHGIATRTGFVWSLGPLDLERALACNVQVVVRVESEGVRLRKTADLVVDVVLDIPTADIRLVDKVLARGSMRLGFSAAERATRLRVGSVLVGADEEDDAEQGDDAARFEVGNVVSRFDVASSDFVGAVLSRRPLVVLGTEIPTIVTFGNLALDLADDAPPEPAAVITLDQ